MGNKPIAITLFVEVQSSWCFWFEPAWAALKERYQEQASFAWKIALLPAAAFPASRAECDIGDRAVFSGVVHLQPLAATVEAMLEDSRAYAAYHAHYGAI